MPIKKLGICLAVLSTFFLAGCGKVNIGYVDTSRLQEAPRLKAIMEEGNAKISAVEDEVRQKFDAREDLTKEEAEKITSEGQQRAASYQQMYQVQLRQVVSVALEDVAKEKKLDAILEQNPNPLHPVAVMGVVDVTDDVVAKLQKEDTSKAQEENKK